MTLEEKKNSEVTAEENDENGIDLTIGTSGDGVFGATVGE